MILTAEQKRRMGPAFLNTWGELLMDAGEFINECQTRKERIELAIEFSTDAGRAVSFGNMTKEDYAIFSDAYKEKDTQDWLFQLFKNEF